ncbi:MAG: acyl-ACP--UDP-N-acetylglucosamine O-acyltransferase [Steroidobacteraceae bacterium]
MIDPRAIVSPRAELDADVTVGPYAIVGPDVVIGAGTTIGPHAVVKGPTRLGSGNRVFQFASIGEDPQDLKYQGEPTRLEIGDRNTFREGCTVNRGTAHGEGVTTIGSDSLFMVSSHVAHDCLIGDHVVFANVASIAGHVEIGSWVQLGGLSAIHQFCKIGAHAFVGGGAIVSRDVPPYVMITGNPAVPHGVNAEGLKRRGFAPEQIRHIRDAYRILYRMELKLDEAAERLAALAAEQPELALLVDFIGRSTRSLSR